MKVSPKQMGFITGLLAASAFMLFCALSKEQDRAYITAFMPQKIPSAVKLILLGTGLVLVVSALAALMKKYCCLSSVNDEQRRRLLTSNTYIPAGWSGSEDVDKDQTACINEAIEHFTLKEAAVETNMQPQPTIQVRINYLMQGWGRDDIDQQKLLVAMGNAHKKLEELTRSSGDLLVKLKKTFEAQCREKGIFLSQPSSCSLKY